MGFGHLLNLKCSVNWLGFCRLSHLLSLASFFSLYLSFSRLQQHFSGMLEVRLMGCQDLLERVPGRSRVASSTPIFGSPADLKPLTRTWAGVSIHSRGAATKHVRNEELGSKLAGSGWVCLVVSVLSLRLADNAFSVVA